MYVLKLREDRERRIEWERLEERRKQKERAERIRKEWERRLNPKTKEDFDLLYSHLESKFVQRCYGATLARYPQNVARDV